MDTADSQNRYVDSVASATGLETPIEPPPDGPGSIHEFESFLQGCFSSPATDEEFWTAIAAHVEREEQAMDARQVGRFEVAVDYILSMHGLPAWTVVRRQRGEQSR